MPLAASLPYYGGDIPLGEHRTSSLTLFEEPPWLPAESTQQDGRSAIDKSPRAQRPGLPFEGFILYHLLTEAGFRCLVNSSQRSSAMTTLGSWQINRTEIYPALIRRLYRGCRFWGVWVLHTLPG